MGGRLGRWNLQLGESSKSGMVCVREREGLRIRDDNGEIPE
jgi:hypothetical protein